MADSDEPGELFQEDLEKDSGVAEALHALQLTQDLSQEVLGKAAELGSNKAQAAAAQVVHALGAQAADETADDQVKRQRLASQSYALKVRTRPKGTSSQYSSGKNHYKVSSGLAFQALLFM